MFKPMLAAKVENVSSLRYPLLASPKLDGIRAMIIDGKVYSRSMKLIPNRQIQALLGQPEYNGLDGELIVGSPTSKSVFRDTTSVVMTIDGGHSDVFFYAFDRIDSGMGFKQRLAEVGRVCHPHIITVEHHLVHTEAGILRIQDEYLESGYEGVMLRDPVGRYKQGRSTLNEGWLMKLKQFHDSEALVVGVLERMHNANEAKLDERGYMKRSSHQENKVPTGTMGALSVKDLTTGVEFEIGTGFTDADRAALWADKPIGKVVRYKFFPTGSKDKPRFPVFNGFRDYRDLSKC